MKRIKNGLRSAASSFHRVWKAEPIATIVCIALWVLWLLAFIAALSKEVTAIVETNPQDLVKLTEEREAPIDSVEQQWTRFIEALAQVESGCSASVVGEADDVGYLQITPTYVRDVNRVVGYERYDLDDRYSIELSIEMFNILQAAYNPSRDLHFALKLHNPLAPVSYHRKVMAVYQRLLVE